MARVTAEAGSRERILAVLNAALRAVDPMQAVLTHVSLSGDLLRIGMRDYDLTAIDRIVVIGGGKADAPMAAALASILGARITDGLVNVKYGHTADAAGWHVSFGRLETPQSSRRPVSTGLIRVIEAGHPVPDQAGQAGAARMLTLLQGLSSRDLVIVLISGGGSALLPMPTAGISLADLQAVTTTLLRCGADIAEINAVRKHCSEIQGGQLVRLAAPAQVAALILSDVVGSPLDAIASGPTVPDRTSFVDALAVLQRYDILDQVPAAIRARLEQGVAGEVAETPKPGDPVFERTNTVIIGDNAIAGRAAAHEARRQGWQAKLLTTYMQGEAREVGRIVAGLAQGIACGQSDIQKPACLVLGGETTVTIRGHGRGGRNQELALAAAIALDEYRAGTSTIDDITIVSLATDGNDGPTDAAGGIATRQTLSVGRALGLDAHASLAANDSFSYLAAVGGLLVTGATNTNVNDLIFIFVS